MILLLFIASVNAEDTIRIGVITDLTNIAAYWGKQTEVGVAILKKDLKASKEKVEIIIEDSSLDKKNAITSAQKLLHADKVDLIYSEFTPTTIAVSPVVKNASKLLFGLCGGNSFLNRNTNAFKSYLNYKTSCNKLAQFFKKEKHTNVAMLKSESEFGEYCLSGFKEVYKNPYVIDYTYGSQVKSQALLLKKKNISALINVGFEPDITNMLLAFRTLTYKPIIGAN